MPKLLQINECINLSTGKIAQQIGEVAMSHGWESWIAYSGREVTVPCRSNLIKVGSFTDACIHYASQRLFDNEGLSSKYYTHQLVKKIEKVNPDMVHMHILHDHWLNFPVLFECLFKLQVPVVWTQHDCWAFTGGCMYFDLLKCDKWKNGCIDCPDKRNIICNQSERNLRLKTLYQSKIKNLTFVSVSDWIGEMIHESNQKERNTITIHNGIDIKKFKPVSTKKNDGKFRIISVASTWDARKGLNDFVKLRVLLPSEYIITLVGLAETQVRSLPEGIVGLTRTDGVEELARLYSESDVYVNTTYSDNFPTVNIESLACGTPVITYKTGGSPEAIDGTTGLIIKQGDVTALANAITWMKDHPLSSEACRKRAEELFDKDKCFEKYITLYNTLLKENNVY